MKEMRKEPKYRTIPVDGETYEKIRMICQAYQTSRRAQGALVGKLVRAEYDKLAAVKLVPVVDVVAQPESQG